MISFTIDPSYNTNMSLMSFLDEKLEKVGQDTFKVMLSYLNVFDLLELVSYYQDPISKLAEELLLKHQITVRRVMKSFTSQGVVINTINFGV